MLLQDLLLNPGAVYVISISWLPLAERKTHESAAYFFSLYILPSTVISYPSLYGKDVTK